VGESVRGFFFRLVITALGLFAAQIVPGVRIHGLGTLIVAALLLGIVNAIIRPIVLLLTLPLTLLTLGLFIFVVNGISLALVAWLVPGFHLSGLGAAILGSIVVSLTSWFASTFVGNRGRLEHIHHRIEVRGRRLDWVDETFAAVGGASGFVAVAAGAFGAHLLRERLSADLFAVFETAARYEMYHALGLLAVAVACARWPTPLLRGAGWLFVAGTVLFSGSLYALALTGTRWLGAVTPFGGLCFLAGWLSFALGAWRGRASRVP
jgi:uncharacterized membrane protein YgdD (TMEM256/DUF423 family)/uncharacterized membrane protein YvlD (DUF360 family)